MELSLRQKIATTKESRRRAFEDRHVEVIDDTPTGEGLLDEALRLMKSDKQSIGNWMDLLSGMHSFLSRSSFQECRRLKC